MAGPTVIFDYDRTLSPGESLVDVIELAIADHRDGLKLWQEFRLLRASWQRGGRSLADFVTAARLLGTIRRRHVEAYAESRRSPPDDLGRLLAELRGQGVSTHLLSSSYRDWLLPIGRAWGFDPDEIHGRYHLSWLGSRAHAVNASHLLPSLSKAERIRRLLAEGRAGRPLVVVGDGREDLDAFEAVPADHFLCVEYHGGAETLPENDLRGKGVVRLEKADDLQDALFTALDIPFGRR